MHETGLSPTWVLLGAAAGLMLHGALVQALLATGVLERLDGDWALHTWLLAAAIAAALAGAGFTRGGHTVGRTDIAGALVGAGLALFTWLEVDLHLLHLAHAATDSADVLLHAAGVALAGLGLGVSAPRPGQRRGPSTAGPSS